MFHLWPISPGNYYYKAHATIHCREIFKVDGLIQCDSIQVNYCPHAMPATCGASHVNYNTFWLLFHHHRYHAPHTLQYDPSQRFVHTKPTPEEINTQQTCFHKRKGKKSDADGVQHRQKYESTLCQNRGLAKRNPSHNVCSQSTFSQNKKGVFELEFRVTVPT